MIQSPADYIIYKGKAALQFSLKPGRPKDISSRTGREYVGTEKGCIFVVAANAKGQRDYDWDNKVTIGLNEHEISKFMLGLRGKGKKQQFYHDPNKGRENEGDIVKKLIIAPVDGSPGKFFINLQQTIRGVETKINGIPIEPEEALGIYTLLGSALSEVLGWSSPVK